MDALAGIAQWPVDHAAAVVVRQDGSVIGSQGDVDRTFRLASVTKLLSAYAALMAVEEAAVGLDTPAGPTDSTVRHLLAHASGLNVDEYKVFAEPGARRIYSNAGVETLSATITEKS